jgi:hypothetical protein
VTDERSTESTAEETVRSTSEAAMGGSELSNDAVVEGWVIREGREQLEGSVAATEGDPSPPESDTDD